MGRSSARHKREYYDVDSAGETSAEHGERPAGRTGATVPVFDGPNISPLAMTEGVLFNQDYSARWSNAVYFTSRGDLPQGVSVSAAGVVSGTPVTGSAGTYVFEIGGANDFGLAWSDMITVTVS